MREDSGPREACRQEAGIHVIKVLGKKHLAHRRLSASPDDERRRPTVALEEASRAGFYGLLARLLAEPPSEATLQALRGLHGDDSELGRALAGIADAARETTPDRARQEFDILFIGLTEGELRPYGSYYQVGFLHERPLAELRRDLAALSIARRIGTAEPEDHLAALCETMHGLIVGAFGEPAALHHQAAFFRAHLGNWAPRFFADLEASGHAGFYRAVAQVGRTFMTVEAEAFVLQGELPPPAGHAAQPLPPAAVWGTGAGG